MFGENSLKVVLLLPLSL